VITYDPLSTHNGVFNPPEYKLIKELCLFLSSQTPLHFSLIIILPLLFPHHHHIMEFSILRKVLQFPPLKCHPMFRLDGILRKKCDSIKDAVA